MFNTTGQTTDSLALAFQHFPDIHGHLSTNNNTVIREMRNGVMVMMSRLEQSLGGDASHIQASATERSSHFDTCCLET